MKKGLTELVIIIDKSGSMDGLEKDVIGGFNSLIKSQKEAEGEVRVTTVFFNGNHERIMEQRDINDVPELTEKDYRPNGCTALLDTVGTFIKEFQIKEQLLKEEDRPEHTIFSIMTDGYENCSKEYTYSAVKDLINKQTKAGWDFIFQAANIDVAKESERLGLNPDSCYEFTATRKGVSEVMKCWKAEIKKIRNKRKCIR